MRLNKSCSSLPLRYLGWLAAFWLSLVVPSQALAQIVPSSKPAPAPVELPEDLTQDQVRDLIARMSDAEVRELVITQLDKVAIAQAESTNAAQYVDYLGTGVVMARHFLFDLFTGDNDIVPQATSIWQTLTENGSVSGWYLLFELLGLLLVGWAAQRLVKYLLRNIYADTTQPVSIRQSIGLVSYGAALRLGEIAAYFGGAILFLEFAAVQAQAAQPLWRHIILFIIVVKLVMLVVNQFLAPAGLRSRLIPVSDTLARQISAWILILTATLLLPLAPIAAKYGADVDTVRYLGFIVGTAFFCLLIYLIVRLRRYGTELIAGSHAEIGAIRTKLSRIWWVLAIAYLAMIWFLALGKRTVTGESSLIPGLTSLIMFASIPYLDMGLQWFITRYFKDKEPQPEDGAAADAAADTAEPVEASTEIDTSEASDPSLESGYIAIALRYARILMVLAILAIFVRLWGIDVQSITAILVGERISAALYDISLTLLLTWTLWGVVRISIERRLSDEKPAAGDEEGASDGGGLGGTRVQTILPIIRFFVQVTLATMAILITLSALGVNIGPLVAGAGVVGLAIGFGAQTLVRDVVSGLFYLIDDAFRIGEYVVIDQVRGTVERISIRSFQLRHHNGPVHTIPYGTINTLTNWSRDWAIMKFELRIPYETDIDMVRKLIKQVGQEMKDDPVVGANMLTPLKSQGVNRMDDSALIIRCKFTSVPGQQFLIRREAFTRIQKRFEEKGIHFAPRRVLVESTLPAAAVAAAAGVLDNEGEAQGPPPDEP